MKKALYINCLMRPESRTKELSEAFFENLKDYDVEEIQLAKEDLKPLANDFFFERQELLEKAALDHPRFRYAHQFKRADLIVIAAPFWDLSFPALLKIYIENVSVDGITFEAVEEGLKGLCQADNLIFLTTRGGFYENSPMEMALPQLKAWCSFFGIKNFQFVAVDGMNVWGYDSEAALEKGKEKARLLASSI